MRTQIINLLLYIFTILVIFCIMYYFIYNTKKLKFDNDNDNDVDDADDNDNNSLSKIKKAERFGAGDGNSDSAYDSSYSLDASPTKYISDEEATANLRKLYDIQEYASAYATKYLPNINPMITDTQTKISVQNLKIANLLKDRFALKYYDIVNKGNASAYKEYLQYQNPNQNSFAQSYM